MVFASGNLRMRPRDMAKLGQLCLNGGVWEGQRIVSEAWIAESTQKHVTHSATSGYGYQWWLSTYRMGSTSVDAFSALGWGGQKIMVFSDLEMVVVFTGGNYASGDPSEEILTRYILPAVKSKTQSP
jgi:CubicO group peptidase (beta-lactamase class C family)